jgi:hypothetical protein
VTTRFRPTVTPDSGWPQPRFTVRNSELVQLPSGVWLIEDVDGVEKELPVDFYLREVLTDMPTSPDLSAVHDFVKVWGLFRDPENRDLRNHGWDEVLADDAYAEGWLNLPYRSLYAAKVDAAIEMGWLEKREGLAYDEETVLPAIRRIVHPSEIMQRMHNLSLFSDIAQKTADVAAREWDLADFLEDMNAALSMFAVRVTFEGLTDRLWPEPTAYTVTALQIANDLLRETPLRTCASETCPNRFTRQRGRSQYGEYRLQGEVKYCSSQCARNQAERERRRRLAKAKIDN